MEYLPMNLRTHKKRKIYKKAESIQCLNKFPICDYDKHFARHSFKLIKNSNNKIEIRNATKVKQGKTKKIK